MSWKKTIVLVMAIDAIVLLVIAIVFSRSAIPLESRELLGIRSLFPKGAIRPIDSKGWSGFGLSNRLRILQRDFAHDVNLQAMVHAEARRIRVSGYVPLGDKGYYAIQARHKSYVMIAVFLLGKKAFWLDMVSSSTLDFTKQAFDACLLGMQFEGKGIASQLPVALTKLNSRIPWTLMQNPWEFMLLMSAFLTLVPILLFVIMRQAGKPPPQAQSASLCTPFVTMIQRNFGTNSMGCCLCLEGGKIVAYRFKKPVLTIDLHASRGKWRLENRRLNYDRYTFILGEESFQHWRAMLPQ